MLLRKTLRGLCDAMMLRFDRVEGDMLRKVASYGAIPHATGVGTRPLRRGSASGRAILDRQTVHIHDMMAASRTKFPDV